MQRQTRHQVPRATMPDGELLNRMYLFKNVSRLRPTYQIRLLAFRAVDQGTKLILKVPKHCEFSEGLNELLAKCKGAVTREDL